MMQHICILLRTSVIWAATKSGRHPAGYRDSCKNICQDGKRNNKKNEKHIYIYIYIDPVNCVTRCDWLLLCTNPFLVTFDAECGMSLQDKANFMLFDAWTPIITRLSATRLFTMYDKRVLFFREERLQLSVPLPCREHANIYQSWLRIWKKMYLAKKSVLCKKALFET